MAQYQAIHELDVSFLILTLAMAMAMVYLKNQHRYQLDEKMASTSKQQPQKHKCKNDENKRNDQKKSLMCVCGLIQVNNKSLKVFCLKRN
jgi:hypothetical protein